MKYNQWHRAGRAQNTWTALSTALILALNVCPTVSNAKTIPSVVSRDALAEGIQLRVLPIGDSITYGAPVEPFNGYRKPLLQMLTDTGYNVDYVGSVHSGDFANNANEGHRAKVIDEISDMSAEGIYAGPNVVLLHAGTNDMHREDANPADAPAHLANLIKYIYAHSPNAAVFVAKIIPSRTPTILANIKTFNEAVSNLVNDLANGGKHVTLVDMYSDFSTKDDLHDELHPNTQGYNKMAQRWFAAIQNADRKGWIQKAPPKKAPPEDALQHCESPPLWISKGEIAVGAKVAHDDGPFQQAWDKVGVFSKRECDPRRLFFPDLDGDGFGDWACVQEKDGAVRAFLQQPVNGKPANSWRDLGIIATGQPGRKSSGVFFADVNGDGRDDYVYVDAGNVNVVINGGPSGSGWQWNNIGVVNGNDVGATRANLQMADIDGDGRADFLIVNNSTGEVTAWLNGGSNDMPDYTKIGVIATGASKTANDIVIMGDFTGNGKADYMLVGQDGKVTGLVNFMQERGFIPYWAEKVTVAGGPANATQKYVRLVDVNGDGKVDYLLLDENGGSQLWLNTGKSGKWQVGDGIFLADLDGNGVSDYIWLDGQGNTYGYLNTGRGTDNWDNRGLVKTSTGDVDLRNVRWAPITNSGRADYIVVENEQGACSWSQNLGSQGDGKPYAWGAYGVLATGPRHTVVAAPYNWKWDSRRVQFADMTGDGLADYLYINTNGAVLMWKNLGTNPPSWGTAQLIADGPSKGAWWTEIRFADTDGAGVADYLQVDRITGRTYVWRNNGFRDDGSIAWSPYTEFAAGPGPAGYNIRIVDMTGEGRADYVSVDPRTGGLTLWKNTCPAGTGDDLDSSGSDDDPFGPSQPVPQLLKDHPDLFYWPVITATDDTKDAFYIKTTAIDGQVDPFGGNWFGTGLFGYDECKDRRLDKAVIDNAYADMWYLTNRDGVSKNIDWNSAAALEYLGPPGNNKGSQKRIQKLLSNLAAVSQSRFKNIHYIHVRCDDPLDECTDRCSPDGSTRESDTLAYLQQKDDREYTSINFCPRFFRLNRLRDKALEYGRSRPAPFNNWLQQYENTALVFAHELLHSNYFMSTNATNRVFDLEMQVQRNGELLNKEAYGPRWTKVLARWQPIPPGDQYPAGYYVSRNADSMAWYALARYVQDKNGRYPHLPMVIEEVVSTPVPIMRVVTTFSNFTHPSFNFTSDDLTETCVDAEASDKNPSDVRITGLASNDAYPADYLAQRIAWIAELGADSTPTTTTSAGSSKATCVGNQVQGDCVTNVLPSSAPFSGPKKPSCAKADGSPGSAARLNTDAVARGASKYCDALKQNKIRLSKNDASVGPAIYAGQAENGKDMTMTILFYEEACPTDRKTDTLDFATYDRQKCIDSFSTVIDQVCAQDSTWSAYNKDFTLMGGLWGNDCAMWSLQSQ